MKYSLFIVSIFIIFSSCKKHESEKLYLNISSTEWHSDTFMINNNTFRGIYLKIAGTSNAELISIEITGDGILGCTELKCNSENKFNSDVEIRFFPINDSDPRKAHTIVTAYSSRIKPTEPNFCDVVGSGDTIMKRFESPYFPVNDKEINFH